MKIYLNKLNKRIDSLVEALKVADNMMTKMDEENEVTPNANKKTGAKPGFSGKKSDGEKRDVKSLAEVFKESLKNSKSKI